MREAYYNSVPLLWDKKVNKYIIYLAAGNSRRFGSNKLLYRYKGKPLYRHGLDMLMELTAKEPAAGLVVVTQYEQIEQEVKQQGIQVVLEERSKNGVSYSIRAGIQAIEPLSEEDYVMFVVADQPCLTKRTVQTLLRYADGETETACAVFGERRGNPALFSMKFKEELLALTGDQGGRIVMRKHKCRYVPVSNEKELLDIDRPF